MVMTMKNFLLGLETGWLLPRCRFSADRPGVQIGYRTGQWLAVVLGR